MCLRQNTRPKPLLFCLYDQLNSPWLFWHWNIYFVNMSMGVYISKFNMSHIHLLFQSENWFNSNMMTRTRVLDKYPTRKVSSYFPWPPGSRLVLITDTWRMTHHTAAKYSGGNCEEFLQAFISKAGHDLWDDAALLGDANTRFILL